MTPFVTVFTTVLSGVAVYVLGQLFLRMIVEPVAVFRDCRGKIAFLLLHLQAKITNASNTEEAVQKEFKEHAAGLIVAMHQIPAYNKVRLVFGVPDPTAVREAARLLNLLSHNVGPVGLTDKGKAAIENVKTLRDIERLLGIKTSY